MKMMKLRLETPDMQAYLQCTEVINFDHPDIKQLGSQFASAKQPEIEFVVLDNEDFLSHAHASAEGAYLRR